MKGLTTLIKLHKRTLDELRRALVMVENQKELLLMASKAISDELRREIQLATEQPDMANFFGDFAKRIQKRQDDIAHEVRELEKKIAKLNDQIAEAFTELKKYEIAKENTMRRAAEAQARRETLAMDEIAEQQHRRKTEH